MPARSHTLTRTRVPLPKAPPSAAWAWAWAVALLLAIAPAAMAQSALAGAAGQSATPPESVAGGGSVVESIELTLAGSAGSAEADKQLRDSALAALGIEAGDAIDTASLWVALERVRALPGVGEAACVPTRSLNGVILQCNVKLRTEAPTSRQAGWTRLHESPDAMVKLVLNGGLGVYSDGNAFFGQWQAFNASSPIAPGPATDGRVSFADFFVEPGVGAIARVGPALWAYGSATVVASGTWGQDIYQRNDRVHVAVEKAYAGLLWAPGKGRSVNASFGRQNYTLDSGFLIHHVKGSTNVGDRRALFLGARTAHERTVLLSAKQGRVGLKLFHLDPDEYEPLESHSRFAGGNLRLDLGDGLSISGSYIENRRSDTSFPTPQGTRVPREGISTTAAHLRWRNALGVDGLLLESELGHQRSGRVDVSAWAGYASAGWRFGAPRGRQAVVLRLAQWSGDDPGTTRYERWDPLLPAGSDEWMGGIVFSKIVANSNLRQWRLRYFAEPGPGFNYTLDWFNYRALETNNLGANRVLSTLASKDLGNELMFTGRWTIGRHHYLQTIASVNWPGEAIRRALPGRTGPWSSLQASLYWFF